MNLTIQQVAKATGLALPTVYTYSSRLKLGKKVDNRKVFSKRYVQKMIKSSKKFKPTKKAKPPVKKGVKQAVKRAVAYASKPIEVTATSKAPIASNVKRFGWTRFLFGKNRIK